MKARLAWVAGAIVGTALMLVSWVFVVEPALAPTPGSETAQLTFTILDATTEAPITGTITLRQETLTGEPMGDEDGQTYVGQRILVEAPVDANSYLWVLVEAEGYADVEFKMRVKKTGTLEAPIRMRPLATPVAPVNGQRDLNERRAVLPAARLRSHQNQS